jgi:hypothetical protein
MITEIIDVTDFVKTHEQIITNKLINELTVPQEWIYKPPSHTSCAKLGIETDA